MNSPQKSIEGQCFHGSYFGFWQGCYNSMLRTLDVLFNVLHNNLYIYSSFYILPITFKHKATYGLKVKIIRAGHYWWKRSHGAECPRHVTSPWTKPQNERRPASSLTEPRWHKPVEPIWGHDEGPGPEPSWCRGTQGFGSPKSDEMNVKWWTLSTFYPCCRLWQRTRTK